MPVVTFSGQGPRSRSQYVEEAAAAGWQTWGKPAVGVDVLVTGEGSSAARIREAGKLGIPVIDHERWSIVIDTGEI